MLVPSLALVRQLLHEWLRETSWENLTFRCVCSDPIVAKGADDLIVHQDDLDFPVNTESASVREFLTKQHDGVKVVFSTYQSAYVVAKGMPVDADGDRLPFDFGIFDEAHKTASRSGTQFRFALEDHNLPIRKRLFFTATPRHFDIRKKNKEGDTELVYSMDRRLRIGRLWSSRAKLNWVPLRLAVLCASSKMHTSKGNLSPSAQIGIPSATTCAD